MTTHTINITRDITGLTVLGYDQNTSLVSLSSPNLPGTSSVLIDSLIGLSFGPLANSSSSNSSLSSIIESLDQVQGTLTLTNGLLTSDLTTPFGPLQQTFNLPELANQFLTTFGQVTGALNLSNGIAAGNLDLGDQDFTGSFNFAQTISKFVSGFIADLRGTVPFQDGKLQLDIPTPFGDVEGNLDFGSGKFISNLTTPFGPLNFNLDFPDDAQFDFSVNGSPGILDLNKGTIEIDLTNLVAGPEVLVPLTSLSGTINFTNEGAIATLATPVGNFSTPPINLAAEVEEELTPFLTQITGTLGVGNGNLTADLTTNLGSFQGTLNVPQLIGSLVQALPQYNGTLTFSGGTIVANLTTPTGPLTGNYNYGQYLDEIAKLVSGIVTT